MTMTDTTIQVETLRDWLEQQHGWRITHVLETHLHADHLSRARQLAAQAGAVLALPAETLVLPGHTSAPVAFDGRPIAATLAEVRQATPLLGATEDAFVSSLLSRIPPTPPNHAQIIALNEQGAALPTDPAALEAGANRCAMAI